MKENITKSFIKNIDQVFLNSLPNRIKERAKVALLDYLCVTLAGSEFNRKRIANYIQFSDTGNYKIIGYDRKVSIKDAIFINGLNSHILDYDDGTNDGIIHLGAPIFSVLLSLAEKYRLDFEKIVKAAVAGYETSFSMACSMQPRHKSRGYHATGTCGILGATLAICYALGLNEKEKFNAFSTACMAASGMLKVLDEGSELKAFNVAKTALLSLVSVQMAQAGFKGPENPLDGDRGYLAMMSGSPEVDIIYPFQEGIYAIERAYVKPYAACRYCHPAIECALKIRKKIIAELGIIDVNKIRKIDVLTYSLAVKGHDHIDISNIASAKMSIPYGISVALLNGKVGLHEYTDKMIQNSSVKRILASIRIFDDDEFSQLFPQKQIAKVEICTDNKVYMEKVDYPKGEPENPFSKDEFKLRFTEMCLYAGKTKDDIEKIYDMVMHEKLEISELMKLL